MKTEAIVFEAESKVGLRTLEVPKLEAGEVLLETLYSTISPGTELRTLAGREKHASPFPLVPGYSTVGRVLDVGGDVLGLELGALASLRGGRRLSDEVGSSWGGHARHLIVPQEDVFLLPDGADPRHATLTTLLATALHGVDLARVRIREQVAVVGLGLVGQLSARLLNYCGANVIATDLVPHRLKVAEQAGVQVVSSRGDLSEAYQPHFPHGTELVVDATGSSKAMKASLKLLREKPRQDPCGETNEAATQSQTSMFEVLKKQSHHQNQWHGPRFIAQGSYADPIEINYYDLFNNEVGFIVPRVHELKDVFRALELVADPRLNLDGLLTETLSFTQAEESYQRLIDHPQEIITFCFDWNC